MQEKASNIILGKADPGDCFMIQSGWFKFYLEIKPLTAKQVIEIAGELSKLKDVDPKSDMFAGLLEGSPDLYHVAKAITIATGSRFRQIGTRAVLNRPLKDIALMMTMVKKQSDPEVFFYTIILAKGLKNILTPKATV